MKTPRSGSLPEIFANAGVDGADRADRLPHRAEEQRERDQAHPPPHVEHPEDGVDDQVLAEDGRGGDVRRRARSRPRATATRHHGGVDDAGQPGGRGPAGRGGVVARGAPGDREDGERDDQGRGRARDRQLGRDREVLGAADPVGERDAVGRHLSCDFELDDDLVQVCDSTSTVPGWSMPSIVWVDSPAGYSSSCSGEEWTWISPATSAVMSSWISWPVETSTRSPFGVTRVALEGHLDDLGVGRAGVGRADSSSPHAVARVSVASTTAAAARERRMVSESSSSVPSVGTGMTPGRPRVGTDVDARRRHGTATRGQRMSERLRPRDVALLAEESPTTPMHNATVEIFEPGAVGLRLPAAGRAGAGPHLVRPALPPAGPDRAGPDRQPDLGRRRALRHRLPRTPLGAAAAGHPRPAARARLPDRLAPAGPQPPAVGDLRRRGPRRRPVRAAHQVAPRARRRHRHRRHRPGAARHQPGAPRSSAPTSGARAAARRRSR